jgi:uncharacterized protein (DUF952 family)
MKLFHLVRRSEWEELSKSGEYSPSSLKSEGFIHLSTDIQIRESARIHFAGVKDLLILTLNIPENCEELRWDHSPSRGEKFAHLYRPLPVDWVTSQDPFL